MKHDLFKQTFIKYTLKKGNKNYQNQEYNNLIFNIKRILKNDSNNILNNFFKKTTPILDLKQKNLVILKKNQQIKKIINWLLTNKNKNNPEIIKNLKDINNILDIKKKHYILLGRYRYM